MFVFLIKYHFNLPKKEAMPLYNRREVELFDYRKENPTVPFSEVLTIFIDAPKFPNAVENAVGPKPKLGPNRSWAP